MSNLLYSRFGTPIPDDHGPNIHLFGSSHLGNSAYFADARTLVDLGFPYKKYVAFDPNFFTKVDYIMLTHEHSDHLNGATLLRILAVYPHIKVLISKAMAHTINDPTFDRINHQKLAMFRHRFLLAQPQRLTLLTGKVITYIPHITSHGPITNVAVELYYDSHHVLYASDLDHFQADSTRQVDGLPTPDSDHLFDILCLEANYDEAILLPYLEKYPNDPHALGNLRHISERVAWEYVNRYLRSDGYFVPLHASETFGTLRQHVETSSQ